MTRESSETVSGIAALTTEALNPMTLALDEMAPAEMLRVMNLEDQRVAVAVAQAIPQIAQAVELAASALKGGGRLVYIGAGTSGRLGVLDASECPPTFGTDPGRVVGLIAGGRSAMFSSIEGAEDSPQLAVEDLRRIGLSGADLVVGIAASGRTPYVLGGLAHARAVGAPTVAISSNLGAEATLLADVGIEVDAGPEVLAGSTRLKAGTAQKLVLNMISTASMVRIGKVYGNLMVDLRPQNEKLSDRAVRIVRAATDCDDRSAREALHEAGFHAKTAIVALLCGVDAETARERLASADGFVRAAIADETR